MIDTTIHLSDILVAGGGIGSLFLFWHKWSASVEEKHRINTSSISNIDQKVDRIESKIDEGRKEIKGVTDNFVALNVKLEKHISADDVLQNQILKQLDKLTK